MKRVATLERSVRTCTATPSALRSRVLPAKVGALARPLLLTLLAAFGCGPSYDHTAVEQVAATSGLTGTLNAWGLKLSEGAVLHARIRSLDTDDSTLPGDVVAENPEVVAVVPTIDDHQYLFTAQRVGKTRLFIRAQGSVVHTLAAEVVAQLPLE